MATTTTHRTLVVEINLEAIRGNATDDDQLADKVADFVARLPVMFRSQGLSEVGEVSPLVDYAYQNVGQVRIESRPA